MICNLAWEALVYIESAICTDPESALSVWTDVPQGVDGRTVIALLNQALDPIAGRQPVLKLTDRLSHVVLLDLVEKSPIKELVTYDANSKELTINRYLSDEDVDRIRQLIRKSRVAFG
jgi:hypothetical protein